MKLLFLIFLIFATAYSCSRPEEPELKAEPMYILKNEVTVDSSTLSSLQPSHIDLSFQNASLYDVVTTGKTSRNWKYFGVRGKVKTIVETEHKYRSNDTISSESNSYIYQFNSEGLLTLKLHGDTSVMGRSLVENYYYDSLYSLSKIRSKRRSWNDTYLLISNYNKDGYLIKETHRFVSGYYGKGVLYHYHVHFNYSDNHDSLNLTFTPITTVFHGNDEQTSFTFEHDSIRNSNKSVFKKFNATKRPLKYKEWDLDAFYNRSSSLIYGLLEIDTIIFDERENIIELKVFDQTIRSDIRDYGFHYSAKYNDLDLIVEKTNLLKNESSLNKENYRSTFEYEMDKNGNWIVKKDFYGSKLLYRTVRDIHYWE